LDYNKSAPLAHQLNKRIHSFASLPLPHATKFIFLQDRKKIILDLRLDCCTTLRGVYTSDRVAIVAGGDLKKKTGCG